MKTFAVNAFLIFTCGMCPFNVRAQGSVPQFALHDGDRVTFYGDSITQQREYTEDVEAFVLTRYPAWKVSFHNAGVGGDRVSGGLAGPIDLRLDRDVFPYKPDVISIMLGMNDYYYRPDQPGIFSAYTEGYKHLVDKLKKNNPGLRLTLIQPSPYDDVTRDPGFAGGANAVLLKYGLFVAQLAQETNAEVADFNGPVTTVLKAIHDDDPAMAEQVIPDRVHPQQGGHWLLAESLLKSWHAPALVSSVAIVASVRPGVTAANTEVTDLVCAKGKSISKISWTQADKALPLPLPPTELDPALNLVLKHSDIVEALDQEILRVRNLDSGSYELMIDGRRIGIFPADQLAKGINLATLETPMLEQARIVAFDTEKVNAIEGARFEVINSYTAALPEQLPVAQSLAASYEKGVDRQRADAQPRDHHYVLMQAIPSAPKQ